MQVVFLYKWNSDSFKRIMSTNWSHSNCCSLVLYCSNKVVGFFFLSYAAVVEKNIYFSITIQLKSSNQRYLPCILSGRSFLACDSRMTGQGLWLNVDRPSILLNLLLHLLSIDLEIEGQVTKILFKVLFFYCFLLLQCEILFVYIPVFVFMFTFCFVSCIMPITATALKETCYSTVTLKYSKPGHLAASVFSIFSITEGLYSYKEYKKCLLHRAIIWRYPCNGTELTKLERLQMFKCSIKTISKVSVLSHSLTHYSD